MQSSQLAATLKMSASANRWAATSGSGVRSAAAVRDAAVSASGVLKQEQEFTATNRDGESVSAPRVNLEFRRTVRLRVRVLRFRPRLTNRPRRASVFVGDYLAAVVNGASGIFRAAHLARVPDRRAVSPRRVIQGSVAWDELSVSIRSGGGYLYQYAARLQACTQLLVQIWMLSSLPRLARARVATAAASSLR